MNQPCSRASTAQAGLGFSGSAGDFERQSEVLAELDALNLRYEGQLQAKDSLTQAGLDEAQGSQYAGSAGPARTAGYMGAAGSILGGIGGYMGRQEDNRYRSEMLRRTSSPGSYSTPFRGAQ